MEFVRRFMAAVSDMARLRDHPRPRLTALEIFKYVGPGLLVTVGFIDPGNWASNVAAGSDFGYTLLWMVTLSTVMLIILQHNAAHLGIATGLCLSEAAMKHLPRPVAVSALGTAVAASVSTALAELLGGAIALRMLFGLPLAVGTLLTLVVVLWMLFSKSYRRLERYIIGFVSLIGLSFIFELSLVHLDWPAALAGWVTPSLPDGSLPVVMSVLGAVVMPHNLFLHSEIIQSRQWNLDEPAMIKRQLKYEYLDTLFSMLVGFCINSAMILLAASAFFSHGVSVGELEQAKALLSPLLGPSAGLVFAVSLLLAGVASSVTAGMAGGSIFAGIFGEPYDIHDSHSRLGVVITLVGAAVCILFVGDPLKGLIYSQIALSIQLPITILLQIGLTSRRSVMGSYVNRPFTTGVLAVVAAVVIALNIMLLVDTLA
ncbi:natural resistance-associated macrophage protein [Solidesulfovibrio carbinoliphilus subsp. oakridgensis]|uniref:Natural resistance-associated macrophage protein n=1 Tax=Solidesulfovibrio carbinoliphilus subsp. oakridgensis TaxID=694327 RepID=G7Q8L8_9BACT|nr:Nramp family divalent metal transporter [Solidesulfovibrio carbinoliphilus]EHJ49105.1 natural resistance-associated macrophage protein [Solidesulfovibrio carbinoliphilus subsp. oakridgensis]